MIIVCATVFGTVAYRVQMNYILKDTSVKAYSSIIITVTGAIINLICSVTLSQFYYWIAKRLTDLGKNEKVISYFFFCFCTY